MLFEFSIIQSQINSVKGVQSISLNIIVKFAAQILYVIFSKTFGLPALRLQFPRQIDHHSRFPLVAFACPGSREGLLPA